MPLTGSQHQQIQDALLAAFDEAGLRRLVKFELDEDLDQVTPPGDLTQRAYNLVAWADKQGRGPTLIAGALKQNPRNSDLQALAAAAQTWHIEAAAEPDAQPPYQGLAFFDEADADRFFGREKLTADLVAYLKDNRFLAVVGASGSGKSSVVRAGVVMALKDGAIPGSDKWAAFIVTPTARPLTTLAAVLTQDAESVTATTTLIDDLSRDPRSLDLFAVRLAPRRDVPRVVLVVDQFEELFTLCKDQGERRTFVDNLLAAASADGVTTVVLTLRADFYAYCAQFDNLRLALAQHQNYIGAMSEAELRAAIEKPAEQGRWDFEPGLVDAILDDVAAEPGVLPLLSAALRETWQRRRGRTLTFAGYHEAGGVKGAIGRKADGVYDNLPAEQQAIARNIFVRLTSLGEGTQDTRRRAPWAELVGSGEWAEQAAAVLKVLEDARLVTAEREQAAVDGGETTEAVYVDVTHEALIREWRTLDNWLHEDREGLLVHRRLTEAAQEWVQLKRDSGVLLRGVRLAQTGEWAHAHARELNDLEREFLVASQEQAEAEQREKERIQHEREEARQRDLENAQKLAKEAEARRQAEQQRAEQADRDAKRLRRRAWYLASSLALALGLAGVAIYLFQVTQANLALAEAELARQEGTRLLQKTIDLAASGNITDAIATYGQALAADPQLTVDAEAAITGTVRTTATRLVPEGETLLRAANESGSDQIRQQAVISASTLFSQALALNPPLDIPVYVWIELGEFVIGGTDEEIAKAVKQCTEVYGESKCEGSWWANEQPQHTVKLDGYWIQRTEVTNEQYKRCVDAKVCEPPINNPTWDKPVVAKMPVTDVDWFQAKTYAEWVGGRLPTEAEWEKACRGTEGFIYPWGDDPPSPQLANYGGNEGMTTDVGSYPPGANGLYDMAGNVWEWTADWYDATYYAGSPERNPTGPEAGDARTLRGGSWHDPEDFVRCAFRGGSNPDLRADYLGFRVVTP